MTEAEKFKVLMIDDDASYRKIFTMRLKSFVPDLDLTEFNSLTSAREFLGGEEVPKFDLVILDEHLPDGRGNELLSEGWFEGLAVLSVSSDESPEIPGALVQAGAAYFLNKSQISEPLFQPLVQGIIDRNRIKEELDRAKIDHAVMDTVKTLVATLRHEINNPLGAVLGAAFLIKQSENATKDQQDAAELVESSGKRIKHVLDQLCEAIELDPVHKANQKVFHIPGDKPWDDD